MKPGDLVLIGDSAEARGFWSGWQHTQPFLVIRQLSKKNSADMSWIDRFGYVYRFRSRKECKVPIEECIMVMNTKGSLMRCPERFLKSVKEKEDGRID